LPFRGQILHDNVSNIFMSYLVSHKVAVVFLRLVPINAHFEGVIVVLIAKKAFLLMKMSDQGKFDMT